MKKLFIYRHWVVFFALVLFLFLGRISLVYSQSCNTPSSCNACIGYNVLTQKYDYTKYKCDAPYPVCAVYIPTFVSTHPYSLPQNSNATGNWAPCGNPPPPATCNQGFYCPGYGPTPTGVGGGCDDPKPTGFKSPGHNCPIQFQGDKCTRIPCGYRDE